MMNFDFDIIYSASMKSCQYQIFDFFLKYTIQLDGYFCNHVSGQRRSGLYKNTSSTSHGTMVHVMHVLFVFFAFFSDFDSFIFIGQHVSSFSMKPPPKLFELFELSQ